MASHGAESTMNPRNDPPHPLFSLSRAEGWSVKANVMKQVLREHFWPHSPRLHALVWCHRRSAVMPGVESKSCAAARRAAAGMLKLGALVHAGHLATDGRAFACPARVRCSRARA